jgi:hypothetical protein
MARIDNTTVYPTVTPAMDDLLIATDVSDNNKTVTFLVSDLTGVATVLQGLQSVLDTGNTATQSLSLTGDINVVGTVYPTTITAVGSTGSAGQILSSTGTGLQWINSPSTSCCNLQDVLDVGNQSTTDIDMVSSSISVSGAGGSIDITSPSSFSNSGTSLFTGSVLLYSTLSFNATGQINDGAGSVGTAGQWLTSTGTGVAWSSAIPPGSAPTLQQVLDTGNTALNVGMTFTGTSVISLSANNSITSLGSNTWSGNNTFSSTGITSTTAGIALTGSLWDGVSTGTLNQVLTSTGAGGVSWKNAATPTANTLQQVLDQGNTAIGSKASITISGTIEAATITDGTGSIGSAGQVLTSTGSALAWSPAGTGAITQVTAGSAVTSVGPAISVSPITGNVVVTPQIFAGTSNIGVVPSSAAASQSTAYLRADGTWQETLSQFVLKMTGTDTSVQAPAALDTKLQVLFGSAQATTSVSLDSAGLITFNEAGNYRLVFNACMMRNVISGYSNTQFVIFYDSAGGAPTVAAFPIKSYSNESTGGNQPNMYSEDIIIKVATGSTLVLKIVNDTSFSSDNSTALRPYTGGFGTTASAAVLIYKAEQ